MDNSYREEVKKLIKKFMSSHDTDIIPGVMLPLSDDNLDILLDRLETNLNDRDREAYINSLRRCT